MPLFSEDAGREPDEIPATLGDRYFQILRFAAAPLARVVELVATSAEPLVFHCAAGKDRTGLIATLLLSLLGVDEEDVI